MFRSLFAIALICSAGLSQAREDASVSPVYAAVGQFTATLHSQTQMWRVAPLEGESVDIRGQALCPRNVRLPRGLWLVGRDDVGRPELVAPSATLLPAGHNGRIALRSCDDPELRKSAVKAYGVPAQVIDLLATEVGAVFVDD